MDFFKTYETKPMLSPEVLRDLIAELENIDPSEDPLNEYLQIDQDDIDLDGVVHQDF